MKQTIFCCGCQVDVEAELVFGRKIYPHRKDLGLLRFWQCPTCDNYVGCHKSEGGTPAPLGVIPTPELRRLRSQIHDKIDPLWRGGKVTRAKLYNLLDQKLGRIYHTALIRTPEEAREVMRIADSLVEIYKNDRK